MSTALLVAVADPTQPWDRRLPRPGAAIVSGTPRHLEAVMAREAQRTATPDELLDTAGVAALLGVKVESVVTYKARYRDDTHNPWPAPFFVVGGRYEVYHRADIEAWKAKVRPAHRPASNG